MPALQDWKPRDAFSTGALAIATATQLSPLYYISGGTGTAANPYAATDGTGGIQSAINYAIANNFNEIDIPGGYFALTTALNLAQLTPTKVGNLAGVGGLTVRGRGALATFLVGSTGGVVIDTVGRGHLTLGDFGIVLGATNKSTIGILQGRAALSITSLTSVATLATATTSVAHGLTTGTSVTVAGASPVAYNGTYTITVTSTTQFTYTFAGGTSPATGTIYGQLGYSLFPQHNVIERVYMDFATATPAANGGVGTIGIYNTGGAESGFYENNQVIADNPLVLTADNVFAIASSFVTLNNSVHSVAQNTVNGGNYYSLGTLAGNFSIRLQGQNDNFAANNVYYGKGTSGLTAPAFAIGIFDSTSTPGIVIRDVTIEGGQFETYNELLNLGATLWNAHIRASIQQNAAGTIIFLNGANAKISHGYINVALGEAVTGGQLINDGGVASGGVESTEIHLYTPQTIVAQQSPGSGNTIHWNGTGLPTIAWIAPDSGQIVRTSAGTYITAGAGANGANANMVRPAALLLSNSTVTGTDANTSPKVLCTFTVPAKTVNKDGSKLRVRFHLNTAANANNKTISVKVNAQVVATVGPSALNAQPFWFDLDIIRTGSATETESLLQVVNLTATAYAPTTGLTADLTADMTITITATNGTASANDIVFYMGDVEYWPIP